MRANSEHSRSDDSQFPFQSEAGSMTSPSDEIVARTLDFVLEAFNTSGDYKAADYLEQHIEALRAPTSPPPAQPSATRELGLTECEGMRTAMRNLHSNRDRAEYIYERMCDYQGADHRGHCVALLTTALSQLDREGA